MLVLFKMIESIDILCHIFSCSYSCNLDILTAATTFWDYSYFIQFYFYITIKLTLPHVSAYSLYQRNKNLHFSYIFLVYRNMFTDYDVGKFLARRRMLRRRDVASTVQALQIRREKQKNTTLRIHHVLPCRFFCRKFDIFCDNTASSLVYPNAPIEGPHKKQTH